jgi:hypothetical protein
MAANIPAPDAPPTAEELAQLRSRGRRDAVIVIIGAALLHGVHHYFVMKDGKFYPKVVYGGAMFAVVGLFGLFQPLIMTRHLPVGKHYPVSVLLWMLLALAVGVAAGWPLYNWYHG